MRRERPLLLYRHTCAKCRFLSRMLVILSMATIQRAPIRSAEAEMVLRAHPESKGKLALIRGAEIVTGWPVVAGVLGCVVKAWMPRYDMWVPHSANTPEALGRDAALESTQRSSSSESPERQT